MSRWFRFYADAMRNPKVARLSDKQFRLWVELLAVASENDGLLPCLDDLRYMLNRRLDHLSTGVEQLISMGLIDRLTDGYEPHNWSKFQYKSDTSNQRVARHRAKRNVTVTPPDTDTDTDTDLSIKIDKGAYAFCGKIIRVSKGDFSQWQSSYPDLDLRASLQSRDDWLDKQDAQTKKKWFNSTSNWLANRQRDARQSEKVQMPIA
jgi:hypothetical protein